MRSDGWIKVLKE
jgi:aubergine